MFGLVLARPSPNKLICLLAVFCIRYEVETKYMLGYLSADIICSEKRTVFRERSSRKTVSFEEQDKYPSIPSPQMEAIVFIILQIFYATGEVFELGDI